jgi:hypothetical protein
MSRRPPGISASRCSNAECAGGRVAADVPHGHRRFICLRHDERRQPHTQYSLSSHLVYLWFRLEGAPHAWDTLADGDQINTAHGGEGPRMGRLFSMICAFTPSSPLQGEGWGEGVSHRRLFSPHPAPLPQRGRGIMCGYLSQAKNLSQKGEKGETRAHQGRRLCVMASLRALRRRTQPTEPLRREKESWQPRPAGQRRPVLRRR